MVPTALLWGVVRASTWSTTRCSLRRATGLAAQAGLNQALGILGGVGGNEGSKPRNRNTPYPVGSWGGFWSGLGLELWPGVEKFRPEGFPPGSNLMTTDELGRLSEGIVIHVACDPDDGRWGRGDKLHSSWNGSETPVDLYDHGRFRPREFMSRHIQGLG